MAKDFTFKQFHIKAKNCGMPVSTDAVMLGAWANIEAANSILDIGCGSGILGIMCAQRNHHAQITLIDIEENAVSAAAYNTQQSPWQNRLDVLHSDIAAHQNKNQDKGYDAIICNPPYFTTGETAKIHNRAIARHTQTLSHLNLLLCCERLLNTQGTASFILPYQEGKTMLSLIDEHQLSLALSRYTEVKTTQKKSPSRLLFEVCKQPIEYQVVHDTLLINEGQGYSRAFHALTQAFYLKG